MKKIVVSLLVLSASICFADELKQFTIMPTTGYYHYSDKQDIDNGQTAGLTFGYLFNNTWRLEGAYSHDSTDNSEGDKSGVDTNAYLVDAVHYCRKGTNLRPLFFTGLGIIHTDNPQSDANSVTGSANLGAGVEYRLDETFALRTDVRDIYSFGGGDNDLLFNFGLNIYFGKFNADHSAPTNSDEHQKGSPQAINYNAAQPDAMDEQYLAASQGVQ